MQVIGAQWRYIDNGSRIRIDAAVVWSESEVVPQVREEFRDQLARYLAKERKGNHFIYEHEPVVQVDGSHASVSASPAYYANFGIDDKNVAKKVHELFEMAMNLAIATLCTPVAP